MFALILAAYRALFKAVGRPEHRERRRRGASRYGWLAVDDDCLVGVVSMDDLLQLFGREVRHLAEGIKPEVEVV